MNDSNIQCNRLLVTQVDAYQYGKTLMGGYVYE